MIGYAIRIKAADARSGYRYLGVEWDDPAGARQRVITAGYELYDDEALGPLDGRNLRANRIWRVLLRDGSLQGEAR